MKVPHHKLRIIFETHSYAKGGKTDEAQIEKKDNVSILSLG